MHVCSKKQEQQSISGDQGHISLIQFFLVISLVGVLVPLLLEQELQRRSRWTGAFDPPNDRGLGVRRRRRGEVSTAGARGGQDAAEEVASAASWHGVLFSGASPSPRSRRGPPSPLSLLRSHHATPTPPSDVAMERGTIRRKNVEVFARPVVPSRRRRASSPWRGDHRASRQIDKYFIPKKGFVH